MVYGLWLMVDGLGFRGPGFGFRVSGLGFHMVDDTPFINSRKQFHAIQVAGPKWCKFGRITPKFGGSDTLEVHWVVGSRVSGLAMF